MKNEKSTLVSVRGRTKNNVLPIMYQNIFGRDGKSPCFRDNLDFALSFEYSMKKHPSLVDYLEEKRIKSYAGKDISIVVKVPIYVAGRKDEPDWTEDTFVYFKMKNGCATIQKVITETDLINQKKRKALVGEKDILITASNPDTIYDSIDNVYRVSGKMNE